MLKDLKCAATIPASDMDRATAWYREKLGLEPAETNPGGATYRCGAGTEFSLYPSQFAGTGQQTVMGWETSDIEADMADLREHGVTFEEYDMPQLKTENGVASIDGSRACWFKDSEGNTLALFEQS